ncbi:alpha/beta fold hydrolase [Halonatronum saccharophilum]|uniref:alpha/beta fold hydrolase n=1 Tax=Halonatronum saccharophilum TaxID=150060 RepID=UPI001B7FA39F|nr:alpha/beta fold hydrolase [Halonatronum saccharophilum]
MKQWILIRGNDKSKPILLWLHGGPGGTQMPLAHHLDKKLEEEFVVVHWDQRGAGKSNHSAFDEDTMSLEQFKDDTYQLVNYLKEKFNRDKIYLLGHSWGTQLGIELVTQYPDDFWAYISVSQVVNSHRAIDIAYDWLKNEFKQTENQIGLNKLKEIKKDPYSHAQFRQLIQLVDEQGGSFDQGMWELAKIALRASEYNILDYFRLLAGMNRGGGPMHKDGQIPENDYLAKITSVEVPIYFLIGKKDYNTPFKLVEEYYELIEAPKKELIIFEDSAHTPFLKETSKFNQEVIKVKEKTCVFEQ